MFLLALFVGHLPGYPRLRPGRGRGGLPIRLHTLEAGQRFPPPWGSSPPPPAGDERLRAVGGASFSSHGPDAGLLGGRKGPSTTPSTDPGGPSAAGLVQAVILDCTIIYAPARGCGATSAVGVPHVHPRPPQARHVHISPPAGANSPAATLGIIIPPSIIAGLQRHPGQSLLGPALRGRLHPGPHAGAGNLLQQRGRPLRPHPSWVRPCPRRADPIRRAPSWSSLLKNRCPAGPFGLMVLGSINLCIATPNRGAGLGWPGGFPCWPPTTAR